MVDEALAPILRVANVAASIAWYQRLGFAVEMEHSITRDVKRTTAVVRRGKLFLYLSDREDDGQPNAVCVLRVEDVGPIANEFALTVQSKYGGEYVELRDPDGNRIRVVAPKLVPIPGRHFGPS